MDINKMFDPNEKPLDNLIDDGGFCGIFNTIACIGDSLSSGEFEVVSDKGNKYYLDMFEHSWGQYIARATGRTVYNFSRGGMSANWYYLNFADEKGLWSQDKAAQAYIYALGVNDIINCGFQVGDISDIENDNGAIECTNYAVWTSRVINRYKKIAPDAKWFFVTMPYGDDEQDALREEHNRLMYKLAEYYSNSYVIDLGKYMPHYNQEFRDKFYLEGHLNAMGYILTGKVMVSYIDYIIRHNMNDFMKVPMINTQYADRVLNAPAE